MKIRRRSKLERAALRVAEAVRYEGGVPSYHRAIKARHRAEWLTLWRVIDDLLEAVGKKGAESNSKSLADLPYRAVLSATQHDHDGDARHDGVLSAPKSSMINQSDVTSSMAARAQD